MCYLTYIHLCVYVDYICMYIIKQSSDSGAREWMWVAPACVVGNTIDLIIS